CNLCGELEMMEHLLLDCPASSSVHYNMVTGKTAMAETRALLVPSYHWDNNGLHSTKRDIVMRYNFSFIFLCFSPSFCNHMTYIMCLFTQVTGSCDLIM
ncbi:hypothetical protein F5I97DRAFT_1808910, partial [Phlebopus sp. FC_14]